MSERTVSLPFSGDFWESDIFFWQCPIGLCFSPVTIYNRTVNLLKLKRFSDAVHKHILWNQEIKLYLSEKHSSIPPLFCFRGRVLGWLQQTSYSHHHRGRSGLSRSDRAADLPVHQRPSQTRIREPLSWMEIYSSSKNISHPLIKSSQNCSLKRVLLYFLLRGLIFYKCKHCYIFYLISFIWALYLRFLLLLLLFFISISSLLWGNTVDQNKILHLISHSFSFEITFM